MAPARVVAIGITPLTVAVVGAAALGQVVSGSLADRLQLALEGGIALIIAALAVVVALKVPTNRISALLAVMGLASAVSAFIDTYRHAALRAPGTLPDIAPVGAALLVAWWVWLYAALFLVLLVYPNGRFLSARWRWVGVGLVGCALAIQLIMDTNPRPYDAPFADVRHPFGNLPFGVNVTLRIAFFPTLCALMLLAAYSLLLRSRRADPLLRRQIRWLVLALPLAPLTLVLSWGGYLLIGSNNLAGIGIALMYLAVPTATAIAILRDDLFDVDRALSSAVLYTALTLAVVGTYAVAAVVAGVLFGHESALGAALVTALLAIVLSPLRTRLQRRVDGWVYPLRRAALDAVADLQRRTNTGEAVPEDLETVLRAALRDPGLRVGYRAPGAAAYVDVGGSEITGPGEVTRTGAEQTCLIVSSGSAAPQLLHEVGRHAASLIEMVRLRADLATSRARLQRLGYDERRRLERDLHDGAQQRLVALGLALRVAQREQGGVDVNGLIDRTVHELGTAVEELRALANGIRPACLDDGLAAALVGLADGFPLPVVLNVPPLREVSVHVATTAYFVACEALANTAKHADATRVQVRVSRQDVALVIVISDDGHGGARPGPGSGLSGLTDRVAAAGGSLTIASGPHGTTVEAVIPCGS
jgi:signal transduction histidine kinase